MKHIKHILFCLTIIFVLTSWTSDFEVGYIDKVYNKGCSMYYTYDTISLEKQQFIFSADRANANIKINGKEIRLNHYTIMIIGNYEGLMDVFYSKSYAVELNVHIVRELGNGKRYSEGTITIKHKNETKTIKVHGEENCHSPNYRKTN